jgi:P-type Ca2+ transporter type 2C
VLVLYYAMTVEEAIKSLSTSVSDGLSSEEARVRLAKFGKNVLAARKKTSIFKLLLSQFSEFLVIILLFAGFISYILGETIDAMIIFFVVLINSAVGVVQEYKAEKALEALKRMMSLQATAVRDGDEQVIPVEELVIGDIIILEEGSKVPADARIIEVAMLNVDEASLTGESVPRVKSDQPLKLGAVALAERKNMLYMGTTVTSGRCKAVVVETGMKTEFGKIAGLTAEIKDEKSPLQKELFSVGKLIAKVTLVICILVFVLGVFSGRELGQMLIFAISIGVAAVPEGLPATLTIALALGVQKMAKKNAIVRKLSSVETLGSTTVICTDKTGTLTKNQMTVTKIYASGQLIDVEGDGYNPSGSFKFNNSTYDEDNLFGILRTGLLCNNASLRSESGSWRIVGDPTEGALVVSAEKAGLKHEAEVEQYKRVYELPFNSTSMTMVTVCTRVSDKKAFAYLKGSPEVVLEKCTHIEYYGKARKLAQSDKAKIRKIDEAMAEGALRVLGFAYRQLTPVDVKDFSKLKLSGFVFQGLQGMIDPPRAEVSQAVAKCKAAGIRIFIITGDHGLTAKAIARQIGLADDGTKVLTGIEVESSSDEDLIEVLKQQVIFARMTASDKMRVVSILMGMGEVVAVTGDGVNDAPALKKANIGVAMGICGTDVTREASKIVLKDDNFASIVNAVEEGRTILDNIKTFMKYIFIGNAAGIAAIFVSMAVGMPLPLTALQIIWFNLVTETIPSLALTREPPEHDVMTRKPRDPKERIIDKKDFTHILLNALVIVLGVLAVYIYALYSKGWEFTGSLDASILPTHYAYATSMAFATLVFFQFFNAFNIKSPNSSVFFEELFNNKWLLAAITLSIALQLLVIQVPAVNESFGTTPLMLNDWIIVVLVASSILWISEIVKFFKLKTSGKGLSAGRLPLDNPAQGL